LREREGKFPKKRRRLPSLGQSVSSERLERVPSKRIDKKELVHLG